MSVQLILRRRLLSDMAGLAGAGLCALLAPGRSVFAKSPSQAIGIQLYMLGPDVANNLGANLQKVAAIGYREVELPSFYNKKGSELRAALDAAGLTCPSIHVPGRTFTPGALTLSDDLGRLCDEVTALGAQVIVMPLYLLPPGSMHAPKPGEDLQAMLAAAIAATSADDWKRTAEFLNEKAAILSRAGLQLAYHNHNAEFAPLADGSTGLEILMQHTDPALVSFELDVGWVAAAGKDPIAVLRRYPGRFRLMHLKDLKPTPSNTVLKMNPADVGSGIIDWPALLKAAATAGIKYYFVEQEPPFAGPPIDSARAGFNFLDKTFRSIGLSPPVPRKANSSDHG
jgi:sugar phosphate isomerase/epimerase